MAIVSATGHSADVDLQLRIADELIRVAQVGPDSLVLREARSIPPTTLAELVVKIDEFEERQQVILHDGATTESKMVNFTRR